MPANSPPVCVAFYLVVEYGVWPYEVPFFRLPQNIGSDLIYLMGMCVSSKQGRLDEIAQGFRFK